MKKKVRITQDKSRVRPNNSEVERLWASNDKAKRLLRWEPQYGKREGLRRGLLETVKWFTQEKNLKLYKSDIYNV
jgi:dTDP-glucose 4,6-dehydratase